ncbi:MAG: protein kinase [Terriglobales bacterium]
MQPATSQPERLAQYDIVEALAQGHSGWVFYKGFDPILRRNATLRAIPKHLLENYGAPMIARLQNEVGAAARLHHPGIVGVYDYGEDSDWAFIATEYVEASCLKERSRISLADAVSLIVQVLGVLDFAHSQGVVHRDIKPSNLLITEKGTIRIANFGVAELNAGTPGYMSPEQLTGSPVDRRSDLFSAGVVLYELLAGVSPFAGPPENLVQRVCNEKERPPSEINPELPRGFDLVCAKALAKTAHERYPSARLFSEGVRDAFENSFASPPGRTISHETVLTATLPRNQVEPAPAAAPPRRDGLKVSSPAPASRWDEATLRTVEKQLAEFLGPLARIVVKEAASKAADLERLYALAAESLKKGDERRAFLEQRTGTTQSTAQSAASKTPSQGGNKAKPVTPDPTQRAVAPEVPPTPKPVSIPKPLVPPKPAPAAKVELNPGSKIPFKPEAPPVAIPEAKPVAQPGMVAKPQAKPDSMPRPVPVPAAPDVAARIEGLIGKQPDTLAGYLHDDPSQLEEVIHAFVASVQALIAMHSTDGRKDALTPQSICFDRLGKATIQSLQPNVTRGTSSGAGNPRYAAPEIFAEKSSGADSMPGAHVYALGVMFYEILLGRRLFGKTFADQRTDLDWLRWHADLESRAPQLKSLLPDYPVALSDLVESMMEKRAEKRPADLESILSRLRGIAQRANKTIVLGKTAAKSVAPKPASKGSSTPRKKSRAGLVAMLLFILVLAGGGFFLWQNPDYFRTVIAPFLHLGTN